VWNNTAKSLAIGLSTVSSNQLDILNTSSNTNYPINISSSRTDLSRINFTKTNATQLDIAIGSSSSMLYIGMNPAFLAAGYSFIDDRSSYGLIISRIGVEKVRFATNGYVAFNTGDQPTAIVDIAASSTTAASLRIRSGVAPTSPNAGDIYNLGTSIIIPSSGLSINSNLTPTSTLQVNGSFSRTYRLVTASTTLSSTDSVIEMTGSSYNVTLPDATTCTGREYIIKNTSGSSKTVNTTSSQTIDGNLTVSVVGKNWIVVKSNGSNWIIIG